MWSAIFCRIQVKPARGRLKWSEGLVVRITMSHSNIKSTWLNYIPVPYRWDLYSHTIPDWPVIESHPSGSLLSRTPLWFVVILFLAQAIELSYYPIFGLWLVIKGITLWDLTLTRAHSLDSARNEQLAWPPSGWDNKGISHLMPHTFDHEVNYNTYRHNYKSMVLTNRSSCIIGSEPIFIRNFPVSGSMFSV